MPTLDQHPSSNRVKILIVGDSGVGKTGGLASLVDQLGLKLRILDFDDGVSTLAGRIKDKTKLATHVHYETLRDNWKLVGQRIGVSKAPSFSRAMEILGKGWPDAGIKNVETWGTDEVLVIDTLSTMSKNCMNMVLQANNASFDQPQIQHYGTAMDNIEKMIDMLTGPTVPCHLIVNTHLTTDEKSGKIYAESLGSKLNPKIPKKFDNMISLSISAGAKRYNTQKDGLLALKTAKPLKENYPLETGLADIFKGLMN